MHYPVELRNYHISNAKHDRQSDVVDDLVTLYCDGSDGSDGSGGFHFEIDLGIDICSTVCYLCKSEYWKNRMRSSVTDILGCPVQYTSSIQ